MSAVEEIKPLARIIECSEEEYFSDPCETPSLSQSIAHTLVSKSPLHAWAEHPKLGKLVNEDDDADADEREKWAIVAGKIIHKLLLGKGQAVQIINADNFRTNYAKAERDDAKVAGRIPVLARKYQDLADAAEFIREQLVVKGFELNGQSEVAFEWLEEGERGAVLCRGRMDHIHLDRALILDVKKIRSAHPQTISRQIYEHGYDIQREAYTRALSKYLGGVPVNMIFLFMEEKPPYAITPVELSPAFVEIGRQRWERALLTWEKCLATNRWPDYSEGLMPIEPQPWVLSQELGNGDW